MTMHAGKDAGGPKAGRDAGGPKYMKWLKKLMAKAVGDTGAEFEPLVLARRICEQLEDKIQVLPGGRKIFPFNRAVVRFYAADDEQKELLRAAFVERQELQSQARDWLERQEVPDARRLRLQIEILTGEAPDWAGDGFQIVCHKEAEAPPAATLTVTKGAAAQSSYSLKPKNKIGRTEEVLDKYGKLAQRNDIVFLDNGDEVNLSVGRIQSRIEFDGGQNAYLLYDDESKQGTFIEREGRVLTVAGRRGIALQNDDVLYFGMARARFQTQ